MNFPLAMSNVLGILHKPPWPSKTVQKPLNQRLSINIRNIIWAFTPIGGSCAPGQLFYSLHLPNTLTVLVNPNVPQGPSAFIIRQVNVVFTSSMLTSVSKMVKLLGYSVPSPEVITSWAVGSGLVQLTFRVSSRKIHVSMLVSKLALSMLFSRSLVEWK